ncbi:aldo/keto reductase [Xenorhabdus nematophila]|uniref:Aldo/keto reductase n=1 Tax=Xenorhabdus nematophila (strain ATCC 19061 / DSM 3370 / CCUG 14189 / LMG 1036 / NCIMB 9965 / AN6) TaxID=406817 RepID=D3VJC3_XENNA|nr:aldo/keto reductase [Xenorhabdus nematophila]CEE90720.1 Aldo/keto reductase [Xenorhabdus nematophila str. Anatoliense]CBJ88679.1 Aldo/keto reductase [Xenorhabdus nematophila ATCC 19061]CCW31927.1 Aldo/keto reductase [Xenorhabdus nematophila F1]CEE95084.1 Aldo/keto reductase [Xenorhabdus nematophila str. Anatoliense]CEK21591.1 Aldo/keto reductase [Xenorhabdus nematophila AN6/1]
MEYKTLGNSGVYVSAICLGTQQFGRWVDETSACEILNVFTEHGGNFIDTADCYPIYLPNGDNGGELSESFIGRWLKSYSRRDDLVIATKFSAPMSDRPNNEGISRKYIIKAVEQSLKRLKTDYIDLYQVHDDYFDVPMEETLRALDDLVKKGLVRYIGCSNFSAWRLMKALGLSDKRGYVSYVTIQNKYNLLEKCEYESELMGLCQEEGIGMLPYIPLAKGFLTGKYHQGSISNGFIREKDVRKLYDNKRNWDILHLVQTIADKNRINSTQVALAWLLQRPGVVAPVVGINSVEQLKTILASVDVSLLSTDIAALNQL